jgi:hypothetical protein
LSRARSGDEAAGIHRQDHETEARLAAWKGEFRSHRILMRKTRASSGSSTRTCEVSYLLGTHVFLWMLNDPERLNAEAKSHMSQRPILVSQDQKLEPRPVRTLWT